MHKDPTDWTLENWLFVLAITAAGGYVHWYETSRYAKRGFVAGLISLFGGLSTGAVVGTSAFMYLITTDNPLGLISAMSITAGYGGASLFFFGKRLLEYKLAQLYRIDPKLIKTDTDTGEMFKFSQALEYLEEGMRLTHVLWDENEWISQSIGNEGMQLNCEAFWSKNVMEYARKSPNRSAVVLPYIVKKLKTGEIMMWTPNQADMLLSGWKIYDEKAK